MVLETLTPPVSPSIGMTDKPEIKIARTDFGDGYTQTTPLGINHIRRVVTLRWNVLALDDKEAIEGFLVRHGGYKPFFYRIPREPAVLKWTCDDWNTSRNTGGFASIEATFRQSFDLRT
ncbi:phage tail protein [Fulvimarina sp. 2208YS6-2-32]|uniref:Phage tail protein n=1 Tax=Fulvimarina uroteuthidis TaxID=3098149 RepID=A0ABU5HX91_9HYPH|nr:phage tail protein [Fulvimarina sp. 2208YS6-2-32]MDY8107762.1 phage tail protein [Fulvimarina sp. 2208YS6-2-32]